MLFYFLHLGTVGFGGPIALAARMEKDLVETRCWISREDYLEGLAFSQLSPGPLAAQLAMYLGWIRAGRAGAAAVSIAFVMPSFLMAIGIAAVYVSFGQLVWIQSMFYGVGAAVIAIIAQSAYRLTRRTIGKDLFLWLLFTILAVTTVWTGSEVVWLFLLSGLAAILWRQKASLSGPFTSRSVTGGLSWLMAGLQGPAQAGTIVKLAFFFAKAGAFVFGSGLAIIPFLYAGVVSGSHWLTEQQFLDAIAVAMITPGPVVITAAFIGYLVAGLVGGAVAAAAVFVPPLLIVILAAPYYRRFSRYPQVKIFVQGVTAAAVGAIAGATILLAKRALIDLPTVLIAASAFAALFRLRKLPEPLVIGLAGLAGLLCKQFVR